MLIIEDHLADFVLVYEELGLGGYEAFV